MRTPPVSLRTWAERQDSERQPSSRCPPVRKAPFYSSSHECGRSVLSAFGSAELGRTTLCDSSNRLAQDHTLGCPPPYRAEMGGWNNGNGTCTRPRSPF